MLMRGRRAQIAWRNGDDVAKLKAHYLAERDPALKPRLQLLWLVCQEQRVHAAAAVVGVHERTAHQWLAWYRAGGIEMLRAKKRHGPGSACRLNLEQQQAVVEHSNTVGFASASAAAAWIKQQFDVDYLPGGIYALFARKQIGKKVPRPMNAKADAAVQEAYKKGA